MHLSILVKQHETPPYRMPLAEVLRDVRIFEGDKVNVAWMSGTRGLIGIYHYCDRIVRDRPQVIIAETWSDKYCFLVGLLLSRLLGIRYVSWSLVRPPFERQSFKFRLGVRFLRLCDHHISYSMYGRYILTELGVPSEQISVVVNVGLAFFFQQNRCLEIEERFRRVKRRNKYRIGYVGSIGNKKRFFDLVWAVNEANKLLNSDKFDLICALHQPGGLSIKKGDYPSIKYLKIFNNLSTKRLRIFYGAIDVLFVPGQGGQVISEALASHVPVFVGEGDGTQFDLIRMGCGKFINLNDANQVSRESLLDLVLDIPEFFEDNTVKNIRVPDHFLMRDQILVIARKVYEDNCSLP